MYFLNIEKLQVSEVQMDLGVRVHDSQNVGIQIHN